MKSLVVLFFGILAIFCPQSTATKMQVKSIANKEEYLKGINDIRRAYAKEGKFPNMNKLYWDDFLETQTQMSDYSGDGKTYRYCARDGNDAAIKNAESWTNFYFKEENKAELLQKYNGNHHMNGMEELTPGQKSIGCSPHDYESTIKDTGVVLKFSTLCFLGPEGNGKSWDVPRGEAGSACPEGYENEDGLCAPVGKAESGVESSGSAGGKPVSTPASRPENSTAPVESSSHGTGPFGVILAMVMIYGMF